MAALNSSLQAGSGARSLTSGIHVCTVGNRARAQGIVRAWMTAGLRATSGPAPTDLYRFERFAAAQYAIARWAPRLALREEAARYFDQARAQVAHWGASLADGARELDGVFAVAGAMLVR